MRRVRCLLVVVLTVTTVATVAACTGSDEPDRPDRTSVVQALRRDKAIVAALNFGATPRAKVIDCTAKALATSADPSDLADYVKARRTLDRVKVDSRSASSGLVVLQACVAGRTP